VLRRSDSINVHVQDAKKRMEIDREIADLASESDSEHRRRRRRRRRKKNEEGMSPEAAQLLLRLARWGVGGVVMLATWIYGFYVADKLGWGAAIFFPAGILAMLCVVAALSIPIATLIVVVVAFVLRIDSGPLAGLRDASIAFAGVGALYAIWRLFVFLIVKREVTPGEAGYK
jgi:hypothetical protein